MAPRLSSLRLLSEAAKLNLSLEKKGTSEKVPELEAVNTLPPKFPVFNVEKEIKGPDSKLMASSFFKASC